MPIREGQIHFDDATVEHVGPVGRGLGADVDSLRVRNAALRAGGAECSCGEAGGALALRVSVDQGQLRVELEVPALTLSALRLSAGRG